MATWLQLYGMLGYSLLVALCIMWAGMGIAYYRAGRGRRRSWVFFVACMFFTAAFFTGLSFVAAEMPFIDRFWSSLLNRSLALSAGVAGWAYTMLVLRFEWKEH